MANELPQDWESELRHHIVTIAVGDSVHAWLIAMMRAQRRRNVGEMSRLVVEQAFEDAIARGSVELEENVKPPRRPKRA